MITLIKHNMAPRAYTREDVVRLIMKGEIFYFDDIFTKCRYPVPRAAGAVSSTKLNRLETLRHRPQDATIKEIRRIAWYFQVHYLVIQRLIERQMDKYDYDKHMLVNSFTRPKEDYPDHIKEWIEEKRKE